MERPLGSDEIREIFLKFFTARQHSRIESASIIPANDPTLLFINAGMAPLKPYFLGEALPPAPDLCNVQPCVRTVDIGDVGDRHHLTFFEMLGSWSIGHYFSDRAVELAFELLTEGFGLAVEKLYMTVFRGDEELGGVRDDLSAAAWERTGVPRDHIVHLGADDNFWSAGETGPCGPCTEVFYDTGPEHGLGLDTAALAATVRVTPGGHRYVVAEDPGLAVRDLASQARRLGRELDAVVVLLLPDQQSASLRIGVSVPDGLTPQIQATAVLDRVLAVTDGRGGGSAGFAQGGGTQPDDLGAVVARIWAALGPVV